MDLPRITIVEPTFPVTIAAGGRVRCVYATEAGSGPVESIEWAQRKKDEPWTIVAVNPGNDRDHTYSFDEAGEFYLRATGINSAGRWPTGAERKVVVGSAAPPSRVVPLPTYDQFVKIEGPEVDAALRAAHGSPSTGDVLHTAWRRLNENWSHDNILRDIRHEPTVDLSQRTRLASPTYAEWMDSEGPAIVSAIGAPSPGDLRHNAFRRFVEGWTAANLVHDIKGEPLDPVVSAGSKESGRIRAVRDVFQHENGSVWSYQGHTAFLLFYRWLRGEKIDDQLTWCRAKRANVLRVLGMVGWPGQEFGPRTPGFWDELPRFVDYLADAGLRVEFVVFADAQKDPGLDQRAHLRRVVDTIGNKWNVLLEIANEPWQNGVVPTQVWSRNDPRPCPMAYGDYDPEVSFDSTRSLWVARLQVLDYLTAHSSRDMEAWARKAKDLAEYRDGSGDGRAENSPLLDGLHVPPVGDEPMGAAEASELFNAAGARRQRSNIPEDFFWYHANAHINGAGSTFHSDAGLQAVVPPAGGAQDRCADMASLAWGSIPPEFQKGSYTRGGLGDLPLQFREEQFPEQTARIYGRILGNRAVCIAIKPRSDWAPVAVNGWRIMTTVGPQNSLVLLSR